jgi:hypothetical protein
VLPETRFVAVESDYIHFPCLLSNPSLLPSLLSALAAHALISLLPAAISSRVSVKLIGRTATTQLRSLAPRKLAYFANIFYHLPQFMIHVKVMYTIRALSAELRTHADACAAEECPRAHWWSHGNSLSPSLAPAFHFLPTNAKTSFNDHHKYPS